MEKSLKMSGRETELGSGTQAGEILGPFREIVETIRDRVLVQAALRSLNAKLDEASVSLHRMLAAAASDLVQANDNFGSGSLPQAIVSRLDANRAVCEEVRSELIEALNRPADADPEERVPEDARDLVRSTADCAQRLVNEIDHGKELLRRLAAREADIGQSRGLRSYMAYRKAVEEVFPGAQLEKLTVFGADGEFLFVVPIRLAQAIDGRSRARQEQKLHEIVHAQDPSLTGLLAFQYIVP